MIIVFGCKQEPESKSLLCFKMRSRTFNLHCCSVIYTPPPLLKIFISIKANLRIDEIFVIDTKVQQKKLDIKTLFHTYVTDTLLKYDLYLKSTHLKKCFIVSTKYIYIHSKVSTKAFSVFFRCYNIKFSKFLAVLATYKILL